MKHQSYLTLLVALLAAFALSSCSETDDSVEEYPDWKKKNEAYFASKYATVKQAIARGDDSWKIFKSYARSSSIEGDATDYILEGAARGHRQRFAALHRHGARALPGAAPRFSHPCGQL